MKYTRYREADKKIQRDLDFINGEINKKIKDVVSIVLTGSFSRGEGPVKKIKGSFVPYNDYDIQIITKSKKSKKIADLLSNGISKKLGYRGIINFYPFKKEKQKMKDCFYIDLKINSIGEIKKFLPRIRNYELRNDSKIIYGKDVRKLIPNFTLSEIPNSEGAKLLLDIMILILMEIL